MRAEQRGERRPAALPNFDDCLSADRPRLRRMARDLARGLQAAPGKRGNAGAQAGAEEAQEAAPRPEDGKPDGERERLIWAMERCGWVQAKAARLLKISPRQMGYALQKYEVEVRKF